MKNRFNNPIHMKLKALVTLLFVSKEYLVIFTSIKYRTDI